MAPRADARTALHRGCPASRHDGVSLPRRCL